MLEKVVDQDVAVEAVDRQDRHHQEVRRHHGEIEAIYLVNTRERTVRHPPPIIRHRINVGCQEQREIREPHRGKHALDFGANYWICGAAPSGKSIIRALCIVSTLMKYRQAGRYRGSKWEPPLAGITISTVQSTRGISEPYAILIRAGSRIPHAWHWQKLANFVGVAEV